MPEQQRSLPTLFIKNPSKVAKRIVACGDPDRVALFADLLQERVNVDMLRGYKGVTGKYNDEPVTVIQHGVGGPSAECIVSELSLKCDVRALIRVGSGEANTAEFQRGDIVLVTRAIAHGGVIAAMKAEGISVNTESNRELMHRILAAAMHNKVPIQMGAAVSNDVFWLQVKQPENATIVDMETATILALGNLYGIKTAAMLIVNENLVSDSGYRPAHTLSQDSKLAAGKVALEAIATVTIEDTPNWKRLSFPDGFKPSG